MKQLRLPRREFLGVLSLGVMFAAWKPGAARTAPTSSDCRRFLCQQTEPLAAPPAIMLHSRHRWLLPRLLDALIEQGYTGITFADLEAALFGAATLPAKPVIITIDDLCPAWGSPSYEAFVAMKDTLVERGCKGVFAVVTMPNKRHNDAWWADMATWGEQGIEFATHTAHHLNLDDPALTPDDYYAEIAGSALDIQTRTGQPVTTLVTPFGTGYLRAANQIAPSVIQACNAANLRFAVGIVEGRGQIIPCPAEQDVIYVGRVPPGIDNTVESAMYEVVNW